MKKIFYAFVLMLCVMTVPSFAAASNKQLTDGSDRTNFVIVNGSTYYLNDFGVNNSTKGIYKMSSNLKSSKLIVAGEFVSLQAYKNTLIVFDDDKGHAVQYTLDGKLKKNIVNVTSSFMQVSGNHIYFYNYENKNFYQSQIVGNKLQYLRNSGNSYVDEFTIHNGWVYYVHNISYDEYGMNSEDFLSKFNIAKPSSNTKLISNMYNIDSLIAKNGYIYAVIHKKGISEGRPLYRVNLNGKGLTRISTQNLGRHAINSKYIYFTENSLSKNIKLYRMSLNGKNVKAIATLPGRVHTLDASNTSLYLVISQPTSNSYVSKYVFQRRVVQ